jgi:hypothetical protein
MHLNGWQGLPADRAWSFKHKWNFHSQPVLLLHHPETHAVLFRAGGLYYLWGSDHYGLFVFNPNTTLPDILEALRNRRQEDIIASDEPLDYNMSAESMGDNFSMLSYTETEERGKDRRSEQMDRGGHPPVKLFKLSDKSSWKLANYHGETSIHDDEVDSSSGSSSYASSSDNDQSFGDDSTEEGGDQGQDDQDGTLAGDSGHRGEEGCADASTHVNEVLVVIGTEDAGNRSGEHPEGFVASELESDTTSKDKFSLGNVDQKESPLP